MGEALGQVLPLAVGVALSPVPVIAVVLVLTTPHARLGGPVFVLGWLVGLGVVGAVVLSLAGGADSGDGRPAPWVSWLKIALGAGLLVVAVGQFRRRPRHGERPGTPKWMDTIDQFGAGKVLGAGAVLSAANPKNLLLSVGAATSIAQTGVPGGQQAVAYAVFAVLGTLGVAAPVVVYLTTGDRAVAVLAAVKDWMARENAVIMSVLCLVIGLKLLGEGIGDLA